MGTLRHVTHHPNEIALPPNHYHPNRHETIPGGTSKEDYYTEACKYECKKTRVGKGNSAFGPFVTDPLCHMKCWLVKVQERYA